MIESNTKTPIDTSGPNLRQHNLPQDGSATGGAERRYRPGKMLQWFFPVAVVLTGVLMTIPNLLQKWLWMRQLDYGGIFWTLLSVKCGMMCAAFAGAFLFLWINIRQAVRNSFALAEADTPKIAESPDKSHVLEIRGVKVSRSDLTRFMAVVVAMLAATFALGIYTQWDTYLRFRYGGSFGYSDPVFGIDVGFFLFSLPFYQLLQSSLAFLTALAIVGVAFQYAYFQVVRLSKGRQIEGSGNAIPHLSVLLLILAATLGCGFYLDRFDLLYSTRGVVYGIGYTADHVTMIGLWVMIGASVAASACFSRSISSDRDQKPWR